MTGIGVLTVMGEPRDQERVRRAADAIADSQHADHGTSWYPAANAALTASGYPADLADLQDRYDRALDQLAAHNAPIETLRADLARTREALAAFLDPNEDALIAMIRARAVLEEKQYGEPSELG